MKNIKLVGVVLALLVLIVVVFTQQAEDLEVVQEVPQDTVPAGPELKYGLAVDSFHVVNGTIKNNQFLADILLKHHVSYPEIDKMVKHSKDLFDIRKIRAGKDYAIFCSDDSLKKAKHFIYMPNAIEYVVFDIGDDYLVRREKKEVTVKERSVYGVINSSLYMTLQDLGVSPALAVELSEIYAWTIDFYRIQKGDNFKIIFDEKFVEGERIGIGNIRMAKFEHFKNDFYAFRFEQGGNPDYFDEKGQSLRKAFLKAPVKFSRISSRFSNRRFHPVQKRWKGHFGTDYAAPRGTPIYAVGDGNVIEARYKKANGNYVKIKHNGTYTTQYLHMNKIAKGMRPGTFVRQGDVIGYVGSTGLATGPHVCFRFWKNGKQVDHLREKFPASVPVKAANMANFKKIVKKSIDRLEEIQVVALLADRK